MKPNTGKANSVGTERSLGKKRKIKSDEEVIVIGPLMENTKRGIPGFTYLVFFIFKGI